MPDAREKTQQILATLNKTGKVFITPTVYKGLFCLRAAFVNWRTTAADLDIAIEALINAYQDS